MKPGLDALTHPRPSAELLASYDANEPIALHGLTDTARIFTALPFLGSLDALLRSWPNRVQAHLPDVADEASSIEVSTEDARKLFATGMGLLFENAHTISPLLDAWLAAIRRDLGLSALTQSRCLVYATAAGKGTAPHFDQNVNLVLQLHGKKKWWLAPNRHVENPMTRHTMGLPVDPELETYAKLPMPRRMPAGAREIVLEAGSLLFVPRGWWHSTEASGEALSLNFTYSAPTWIDVLTVALRSRLAMSSEWRATASPAAADDFEALLRQLAYEAPEWRALDILGVTESADDDE